MLNIVLFGPPGSGKGTQSAKLIDQYNLVHLSTGDILRSEVAAGSWLGQKAKAIMDQGNLVPDEIVIDMIAEHIDRNSNAKGFIFDGFPRTGAQAVALDEMLAKRNTSVTMMIELEVGLQELINRLLNRGQVSGRADDQDVDVISNRIAEYNNKTAPVKDYYAQQNKYFSVYGSGDIETIFEKICNVIDARDTDTSYETNSITETFITENEDDGSVEVATITYTETHPVAEMVETTIAKPTVREITKAPAKKVKKATKPAAKKVAQKSTAKKVTKKKPAKKVAKKSTKKLVAKKVKKAVAKKKSVAKSAKAKKTNKTKKAVKKVVKKEVSKAKKTSKLARPKGGKKAAKKSRR